MTACQIPQALVYAQPGTARAEGLGLKKKEETAIPRSFLEIVAVPLSPTFAALLRKMYKKHLEQNKTGLSKELQKLERVRISR